MAKMVGGMKGGMKREMNCVKIINLTNVVITQRNFGVLNKTQFRETNKQTTTQLITTNFQFINKQKTISQINKQKFIYFSTKAERKVQRNPKASFDIAKPLSPLHSQIILSEKIENVNMKLINNDNLIGVFYEYNNFRELLQIRFSVLIFLLIAIGFAYFLFNIKKSTHLFITIEKLQNELSNLEVNLYFDNSNQNDIERITEIKNEIDELTKNGFGFSSIFKLSFFEYFQMISPLLVSFALASFSK